MAEWEKVGPAPKPCGSVWSAENRGEVMAHFTTKAYMDQAVDRHNALEGCPDPRAFVLAAKNTIAKLAKDGTIPGIDEVADFAWLKEVT